MQSTERMNMQSQRHARHKHCPITRSGEHARSLLQLCDRHCRATACAVAAHCSSVLQLRPAAQQQVSEQLMHRDITYI